MPDPKEPPAPESEAEDGEHGAALAKTLRDIEEDEPEVEA
jgi:hypothetical protein